MNWLPDKFDAIYGAMAGGLIAFLSSFFTNRHSLKRQKIELSHQAQQKENDRQYVLKREIYLPLIEAVSDAVSFVVQVPTIPFERLSGDNPIAELEKQISKLNLIAPPEVMEPVTRGKAQLIICYMTLTSERLAIQKLVAEIARIESNINLQLNHQQRFLERFERHLDQGTGDQALRQSLATFIDNVPAQINLLVAEKQALLKQKFEMELNLSRRANLEIGKIRSYLSLLALRRDIGMAIDDKWWTELVDSTAKEIDGALTTFYSEVEQKTQEAFGKVPAKPKP